MLAASVSFALMGLSVKFVASPPGDVFTAIPVSQVIFLRSLVIVAVALIVGRRDGRRLLGRARGLLALRGILGVAGGLAYYYAIAHLPLGNAVLLFYLSPLYVAVLAPSVLGERVHWTVWGALALGYASVLFVETPARAVASPALIAGFAAPVLVAISYLVIRRASRTDTSSTIVLWFGVLSVLGTGGHLLLTGTWIPPAGVAWLGILAVGLFGGLGQLLMTRAYAVAPVARVSVFSYATPVLAYLLAEQVLGEPYGWGSVVGCMLLLTAGFVAASSHEDSAEAAVPDRVVR